MTTDGRAAAEAGSAVVVTGLRTADDSGLPTTGTATPRMSWRLASDRAGVRQSAYEVQVAASPDFTGEVATSGEVRSSRPLHVPWPAQPLRSREVRWWRVRARTDYGMTAWSEPARVEAALLEAADWVARPVTLADDIGRAKPGPVPLLRREFTLDGPAASARLYVTALGLHDVAINGRPVSDELLEPGWQSYHRRLLYATYDVTGLLAEGPNAISAAVGDGWYRGTLTWRDLHNVYGDASCLLAQLEIRLAGGGCVTIATDGHWRASTGALQAADLYDGTDVDLRLEPAGWRRPGFDDSRWQPATERELDVPLAQRTMPPVRVVETRRPARQPSPDGHLLVDAGQNLTGYLRLRVTGPEGGRVSVRHAEVLDGEGRLHTVPLRTARAADTYVLPGGQAVLLEPAFTFHGFRYAEIEVSPGVTVEDVQVIVISSDLSRTGQFECSDERVSRLFRNVTWSQRGNFLALPTDCPQRDERLGWTGDIMVFAPTACATADSRAFLVNWLIDLAHDQRPDGAVPSVVPNVLSVLRGTELESFEYGSTGWGDAATVVPWTVYEAYADAEVLRRQYPSMRAWVDWCAGRRGEDGTWSGDWHFGDWLDPGAPPAEPEKATTSSDYIATAYLSHSAGIVAAAASLLGDHERAASYAALRDQAAAAAWRKWSQHAVTTQAGCAVALQLEIAPAAERPRVAAALAALVRAAGGRIGTGFLGTPLVLPALTAGGHIDEAYQVLLNTQSPGWLYQVRHGATTMWERWDAIQPDGSIHPGEMASGSGGMLSFNHYAYGAVADWLYRSLAGIAPDPDDPGYGTVVLAPVPGGGITSARASIDTPYGPASISWAQAGQTLTIDVQVAPGARGWFVVPPGRWHAEHDGKPADAAALPVRDPHGRPGLELESGRHHIVLTQDRDGPGS